MTIDVKRLITHRVDLKELPVAIEEIRDQVRPPAGLPNRYTICNFATEPTVKNGN